MLRVALSRSHCGNWKFGVKSCVVAVQPLHRSSAGSNAIPPAATWVRYPSIPGGIGLASAGTFLYARLISKVRKLHRSQRIDLIHAHAALPCGHAAVRLSQELKIPCVVTVHGLDAFFDNQVRGYAGQWCKRVAQFVYRSASRVICISDKVAEKVVDGAAAPVNTTVIYNSVDAQMFSPASADCASEHHPQCRQPDSDQRPRTAAASASGSSSPLSAYLL